MEQTKYSRKRNAEKALLELQGIYQGIAIDRRITETEKNEILHWMKHHKSTFSAKIGKELEEKLIGILADKQISSEEREDLDWFVGKFMQGPAQNHPLGQDLIRLHGLMRGILADNQVTTEEALGLRQWIHQNQQLEGVYPYDEIWSMLKTFLEDGKIDLEEEKILKSFFSDFVPKESTLINLDDLRIAKEEALVSGICAFGPDIQIQGKVFCATGVFGGMERKDLHDLIEQKGGIARTVVSSNTDYLIVGGEGNPAWMYSCYGRKVELAINLRKKGGKIVIVHEADMKDALFG